MGSDISSSMKTAALVLAFALGVSADGRGGHSHAHAPVRRGRQEEAPLDAYAQPGYEGDLDSPVKVKLMEDIMPMVKPNAKFSTFAQLMELVVSLSTVSCAPTEPSSTRTTSSVTGGLTLIVLKLKVFSLATMKLLLNVLLLMKLPLM